jgi:preprotein translocase subunit Sec63
VNVVKSIEITFIRIILNVMVALDVIVKIVIKNIANKFIVIYDDVLDELVCFHSYKILGVNKTSNKEEILKAYRKSYIYLFPNKGLTKEMNDHNEKIDKAFKKLNI